jgi:hypothetical protein
MKVVQLKVEATSQSPDTIGVNIQVDYAKTWFYCTSMSEIAERALKEIKRELILNIAKQKGEASQSCDELLDK